MSNLSMRAVLRNLARLVLSLLPAALVIGFIWMSFGTGVTNFMPHYDVDQYIYWHELATFAHSGFHGGYYGVNELLSPLKGFGPHGIGIIMVYGGLYSLAPWLGFAAMPVMNIALLALALFGYVWITRPPLRTAAAACLATALYPPLFMYLPTGFQEGFHYAAAVVLAMVFITLIEHRDKPDRLKFQIAAGIFLLVLSFVRYTWAVCFVPYFYMLLSGRRWRFILSFLLALLVTFLVVRCFNLFVPSWYTSPEAGIHIAGQHLGDEIGFLLERAAGNARTILDYKNNRNEAAILLGLLAFSALGGAVSLHQALWKRKTDSPGAMLFLLIAMNTVALGGIFIVAWTGSGRHLVRLLSANYIFCFIMTTYFFPRRIFNLFIAYNAALLPLYMASFQIYHLPGYINTESRIKIQAFRQQVSQFLTPSTDSSPWDKTIFVDIPEPGIAYLGIPPEFGIQKPGGKTWAGPRLSRYALLATPLRGDEGQRWKALASTVIGTLYVNSASPVSERGNTP